MLISGKPGGRSEMPITTQCSHDTITTQYSDKCPKPFLGVCTASYSAKAPATTQKPAELLQPAEAKEKEKAPASEFARKVDVARQYGLDEKYTRQTVAQRFFQYQQQHSPQKPVKMQVIAEIKTRLTKS